MSTLTIPSALRSSGYESVFFALRKGLPPLVAGSAMFAVLGRVPAWVEMWLWAAVVFFGFKWIAWRGAVAKGLVCGRGRMLAYFGLWAGMDAERFCNESLTPPRPRVVQWLAAIANVALGMTLLAVGVRHVVAASPMAAGLIGLIGLVLVLHFGLLQLLALAWRAIGVDADPIMHCPVAATSLADFWGRRWNRAFRVVADRFLYRPLGTRLGPRRALLMAFLFSGLVHDLVISVPARAGYGLPTIYFLLQGSGIMLMHSTCGHRARIHRGLRARLFAASVLITPLGLLFHRAFLEVVGLSMLRAMGCY